MFKVLKGLIGPGLLMFAVLAPGDDLDSLKDPTQPLRGSVKQTSDGDSVMLTAGFIDGFASYKVVSILVSPSRKIAIVNGEQVQIGSVVDGASVVAIERDSVSLSVNNETRQIFMNDGTLKQETP